MSDTEPEIYQKISDRITQLEAELERALKVIVEQAGSKLKPEGREKINKEIEDTRQLLERLKSKYV